MLKLQSVHSLTKLVGLAVNRLGFINVAVGRINEVAALAGFPYKKGYDKKPGRNNEGSTVLLKGTLSYDVKISSRFRRFQL